MATVLLELSTTGPGPVHPCAGGNSPHTTSRPPLSLKLAPGCKVHLISRSTIACKVWPAALRGSRRQVGGGSTGRRWSFAVAAADGLSEDRQSTSAAQSEAKPSGPGSAPAAAGTLPGGNNAPRAGAGGPRRPGPVKPLTEEERERRQRMEDELKDSRNFVDFLAPRPLRRVIFAFGAASCFVGFLIASAQLLANPSLQGINGSSNNVGINLLGAIGFAGLFVWEGKQAEVQKIRRKKLREAQIRRGDREVYTNESGEKMSRLKPVDDEWIIRRLDRWGAQDGLPQIGPKKGAVLQDLVRERAPQTIVEVGTFTGYSAIKMAQAASKSAKIISIEKDLKWVAVAKRFISQAKMSKQVDVRWGEAVQELQKLDDKIDFLFLDAVPSEYLAYLKAAEPRLSDGAVIVADNAGLYSSQMQEYLDYVQTSSKYESRYIPSTLEYRDDVADGLEVSTVKVP